MYNLALFNSSRSEVPFHGAQWINRHVLCIWDHLKIEEAKLFYLPAYPHASVMRSDHFGHTKFRVFLFVFPHENCFYKYKHHHVPKIQASQLQSKHKNRIGSWLQSSNLFYVYFCCWKNCFMCIFWFKVHHIIFLKWSLLNTCLGGDLAKVSFS